MKNLTTYDEFLNEGYGKRNSIEEFESALRQYHPRSGYDDEINAKLRAYKFIKRRFL